MPFVLIKVMVIGLADGHTGEGERIISAMRFQHLVFAAALPLALPLFVWGGLQVASAPGSREVMATMVDPSANFIWRSVSTIVTAEGVKETFPRNDAEWKDLRQAAARLAAGGALLKKDRRRAGDSDWLKWSQAIVDAADTTLRAVDAKSRDRVLEAGEEIYNTCVGCHGGYYRMAPPP